MRRKAAHIIAAIAEFLRFLAIMFLAFDVGAFLGQSASSLLRYAAAPQLLFAAGFFFLWLDPGRYGPYRPLLMIGKAACAICFVPLAAALARDGAASAAAFGLPYMGLALAFFIAAVDIVSLSVLILVGVGPAVDASSGPSEPPGQGPESIERVEDI